MIYIIFHEYFLNKDIEEYSKLKNNENVKFIHIFWKRKMNTGYLKIIRKISELCGIIDLFLDYEELKEIKFEKEDKIIYFDFLEKNILKILRKYTNNNLEIFWIWNKVNDKEIAYLKSISNNIWTFDIEDKKKYDLKYVNQFYWRKNENYFLGKNKNKVFFIGQDKGRIDRIDEIVEKLNLFAKILIQKQRFKFYKSKYKKYLLKSNMNYLEVLEEIKKSDILLEICKKDQKGITLRTLEALFFNKKLITNNLNIKNYDFYDENNIFIIEDGKEIDKRKFQEFLRKDKKLIDENILKKYTIEHWLEQITQ